VHADQEEEWEECRMRFEEQQGQRLIQRTMFHSQIQQQQAQMKKQLNFMTAIIVMMQEVDVDVKDLMLLPFY